jgi:hypothetical protein
VPGVGANLQEGRPGPDERAVGLDDGSAPNILVQVAGDGAFGSPSEAKLWNSTSERFTENDWASMGEDQLPLYRAARGIPIGAAAVIGPASNLFCACFLRVSAPHPPRCSLRWPVTSSLDGGCLPVDWLELIAHFFCPGGQIFDATLLVSLFVCLHTLISVRLTHRSRR